MIQLDAHVKFFSGVPQFRITETQEKESVSYSIYNQNDLIDDLMGSKTEPLDNNKLYTNNKVDTLSKGDVVFSLISGMASMVREEHDGYLYTHNYVKMLVDDKIDAKFLVYLLNEDKEIKKQFQIGLQGSTILKYTVKQLKQLKLSYLPSFEKQKVIGEIYLKQLKVETLKHRVIKAEKELLFYKLEEMIRDERTRI